MTTVRWLHGTGPLMSALDDTRVKVALALAALLGPARDLLLDGFKALGRRAPNMNSLVALASLTSFSVGILGKFQPGMAFDSSFIDEPVRPSLSSPASSCLNLLLCFLTSSMHVPHLCTPATALDEGVACHPDLLFRRRTEC